MPSGIQLKKTTSVPSARSFNSLVDILRSRGTYDTVGGDGSNGPGGQNQNFASGRPIPAIITGGSGPAYSWDYGAWTPSGWQSIATGGTTSNFPAVEINGATGIAAGHGVELYPGNVDYRFQLVRRGSPSCTTKICLSSACGGGATNVLVTILNGSTTISSGTTDSTGCVTLSIPSAGSYTVTTAATARYNSTSGTHALTCSGVTTISLSTASGYSCLVCWQEPVPNTLYLTVAGTAYPVININSGPTITASVPISNLLVVAANADCTTTTVNPCTAPVSGNLSVPFVFGIGGCSVNQQWSACTDCAVADTSGSPCPTPVNSTNYPYFVNGTIGDGFGELWQSSPPPRTVCSGLCGNGDSSSQSWSSRPVPVNITITFPIGVDGTNPPVLTATLTE
jgi:hypothetical protein